MNVLYEKNIEENNIMNSNIKYNININYNNRNYLITIDFDILISELKKIVFSHFKIDYTEFDLYYKDTKILLNDDRPIALLFQKDIGNIPLLFLVEKIKKNNLVAKKAIYPAEIFTKYPLNRVKNIVNEFFEYKNYPNDAIIIKSKFKGFYQIKFRKSIFATEFKQFFDINYNNKLKTNSNIISLPKINVNESMKNSNSNDNIYNNSKSYKNRNSIKYINNEYSFEKAEFPIKYINSEEKYFKGKIIDTKNWLYKNGFINNTNKYNINNHYYFIKNYVGATPNIPPILHKFRDVSKNLWLDKKGFYL
jgi:hypothetical protein